MPVVDGFTFPAPDQWLADTGRLSAVGTMLLDAVHAGLVVYDLDRDGAGAERWQRMFVGHGREVPVESSIEGQLTVCCQRVMLGLAGQELYQPNHGAIGKSGFQTAMFQVRMTLPYPIRQGKPVATTDAAAFRDPLWAAGLVMWATLNALALGGVVPPQPSLVAPEAMSVGPLMPVNPSGGQGSWTVDVGIQLSPGLP